MSISRPLDRQTRTMKSLTATIDTASAQPGPGLARSRIIRRTTKLLSYGALASVVGVLLIVAAATLPVLFGYHTYVINGGSMEPALQLGSVAITSPTNARGLEVGDIIAYRESPENPPVLHRIVQVTDENGQLAFLTQGDQNRTPDRHPVVLQGNGDRVVYTVPYAGYILNFAQSTPGRILLLAVPAIVLAAMRFWPGKRMPRLSRAETQAVPADVAIQPPIETAAPAEVAVRLENGTSIAKALQRQEDERRELAPSHPAARAVVHSTNVMPIERRLAQAERREMASSERSTPTPAWPSLQAQAEQQHLQRTPTRLSLEAQAVRLRLFQHPAVRRGT